MTNVENQTMSISYGVGSYVNSITRFDGSAVSFEYDGGGRLATVAYPSATNSFTYFANGLLDTAANVGDPPVAEAGMISNSYNGANRLTASIGTAPSGSVTYALEFGFRSASIVSLFRPCRDSHGVGIPIAQAHRENRRYVHSL